MRELCTIGECQTQVHGHGMCSKHYQRSRSHGDALYEQPIITQCRVESCERSTRSKSKDLCEMHYYRIRRHGSADVQIDTRQPHVKYKAAHARVWVDKGKASTHDCVDCGGQAYHWSYTHGDPDELYAATGQPYSLSSNNYEPRCRSCHAIFDSMGRNQYS